MILQLKNVCKLSKADITIDGITVIAGENNSGKSTVGKMLWSIFNSLYDIDEKIQDEIADSICRILDISMGSKREIRSRI